MIEQRFVVIGKVQGVFFRKTFTKILTKRGLKGGATNHRHKRDHVLCTAIGSQEEIQNLLNDLRNIDQINSYGATITDVIEKDHGVDWEEHDVSTKTFDDRGFAPRLKIFL